MKRSPVRPNRGVTIHPPGSAAGFRGERLMLPPEDAAALVASGHAVSELELELEAPAPSSAAKIDSFKPDRPFEDDAGNIRGRD